MALSPVQMVVATLLQYGRTGEVPGLDEMVGAGVVTLGLGCFVAGSFMDPPRPAGPTTGTMPGESGAVSPPGDRGRGAAAQLLPVGSGGSVQQTSARRGMDVVADDDPIYE